MEDERAAVALDAYILEPLQGKTDAVTGLLVMVGNEYRLFRCRIGVEVVC